MSHSETDSTDLLDELAAALKEVLREVDFDFGGWGDLSVLESDEPDHYAVRAYNLLHKYENDQVTGETPSNDLLEGGSE